jgi:NADPH2:quinone reductase
VRRVMCHQYGPASGLVVEEAADPHAGPGEVVVAVRAAGVSFVDGLIVGGAYQVKPPLPFTPGLTVAGDVVEIGEGASGVAVGDRVAATTMALGGYASHRVLPTAALNRMPDGVGYDVAATAVESYATMVFALTRRTTVTPGEWMVVLGAGGGIGLAAIDVGRSLGARVIAAAASEPKRAAAFEAGAEVAIDYGSEDLKARVREITGGGADLAVDPVGDRYAEPALRSLRPFGRYLVIGFAGGSIPRLPANLVLLENRTVVGIDWGAWARRDPVGNLALVDEVFAGIAAGRFHPPVPTAFPLEKVAEALDLLAGRRVTGKLVLTP